MSQIEKNAELQDIQNKLKEHGFDPACKDEEKLSHLWHLYIKTEANLKIALDSIVELRQQQTEEMKEVENYVDHIKNLSEEREALTLEFEAENEMLKEQVQALKQELEETSGDVNAETTEMLLQQGLEDIAHGTTSEQVAYLLVERARLMDELEAEQLESSRSLDHPHRISELKQLQAVMEEERQDFEDELRSQRESTRKMKQRQEEEMSNMISENTKIQMLLEHANERIQQLDQEKMAIQASGVSNGNIHMFQAQNEDLERQNKDIQLNFNVQMVELRNQKEEMENDNRKLAQNLRDLLLEKDATSKQIIDLNEKVVSLQTELMQKQEEITHLQIGISTTSNENDMLQKYTKELDEIKREKLQLQNELQDVKDELRQEKLQVSKGQGRVQQIQSELETIQKEHENQNQILNNKVQRLEEKITTLQKELSNSQRENLNTKSEYKKMLVQAQDVARDAQEKLEKELNSNVTLDGSKDQERKAERQIILDLEENLTQAEQTIKESKEKIQVLQLSKEDADTELEHAKNEKNRLQQDLQKYRDRIQSLESMHTHLDIENKNFEHRLSENNKQLEEREHLLQLEREKTLSLQKNTSESLSQAQNNVEDLHLEVRTINLELMQKQEQVQLITSQTEYEKKQSESLISELRLELDRSRANQMSTKDATTNQLENVYVEARELRHKIGKKEEEILKLQQESQKLRTSELTLETQVDMQRRLCSDLEKKNSSLEAELTKALQQSQESFLHSKSLEIKSEQLKTDLETYQTSNKQTELFLTQKTTDQDQALRLALVRAEAAENKLSSHQRDQKEALAQLELAENQLKDSAHQRNEIQEKKEEIQRLRNQIQDEILQRSLAKQSEEHTQHQMNQWKLKERETQQRNTQLQLMLLELESKMDQMKNDTLLAANVRNTAEEGKRGVMDQVQQKQLEIQRLQIDLHNVTEKYDNLNKRYNDRKLKIKTKLQKAREMYNQEKSNLKNELDKVQDELVLTKSKLNRELEWKERMESSTKRLMTEKRDLLSQLTENDEVVRDNTRQLSVLQVRVRFLEEENSNFQERVTSLTKQKQALDKIVKEFQYDRNKEVLESLGCDAAGLLSSMPQMRDTQTSGLGSSLDFTGESTQHLLEAIISPRVKSPAMDTYGRLSSTLPYDFN